MSTPYIKWQPNGHAYERVLTRYECPDKYNPMRGRDAHGSFSWKCNHCGSYGGHQSIYSPSFVRRPEYDAPEPGSL